MYVYSFLDCQTANVEGKNVKIKKLVHPISYEFLMLILLFVIRNSPSPAMQRLYNDCFPHVITVSVWHVWWYIPSCSWYYNVTLLVIWIPPILPFLFAGAPQVLRYSVDRNVQVEKGQDAVIKIVFCSDPQPLRTSWEWGSLQLEAGNGRGRYVAENLAQVPSCSWDQHDIEGRIGMMMVSWGLKVLDGVCFEAGIFWCKEIT